jgi:beta-N-acetylhexosaminidase
MVMMGHLLVKALDPNLPASLSPAHIDGLLRKELGFNGVVITDDLEMSGITSGYSIEERVLLALKAGTDMLLVCHQQDQQLRAMEAVIKAVEGRIIKPERLLQSVARIEELVRLSAHARSAANAAELSSILGHPDHQSLAACFS